MYEVQVNIRQIMRISLCSGASVRGFSLLCTDAAVFIVFGLICCSVGAHIGDPVYRRGYGTGRNMRKWAGKWFSECGMFRENGGRRNGLRVPVPKWIRAGMPAVENVPNFLRTPFVSR